MSPVGALYAPNQHYRVVNVTIMDVHAIAVMSRGASYSLPRMEVFDADHGRTLSYDRHGAGPLVICVPGGPGFDPAAYFAATDIPGHELLIFAPRGTGESSWPDAADAYRISDYVEDVESLRVHLGLERLTLYGNSHGGCVTLAYATAKPQHVERFVITNSPSRIDERYAEDADEVQQRFIATFIDGQERLLSAEESYPLIAESDDEAEKARLLRRFMARYTAKQEPAESAYLDRLCSAPMNYASVDVMYAEFEAGLDLLLDADRALAPALVIGSEFDAVVPAVEMRRIADALPNATYLEIAGVGHFPEVEAPARFSAAVAAFLKGWAVQGAVSL
jgi:pimeloyl-ACP methyl ester carboxylesterase